VKRALAQQDEREREIAASEVAAQAERIARAAVEHALEHASEERDPLEGARRKAQREERGERLRAQLAAGTPLLAPAERLIAALKDAAEAVQARASGFDALLAQDRAAGDGTAAELRACAEVEAGIQARLRTQGEAVTSAEVAAQRGRDQYAEAELELRAVVERLGVAPEPGDAEPLGEEEERALIARLARLQRRREQLGPVNPLAQEEYAQALEHVEELESRRSDLETALRELRGVIRDTDRQIQETFQATFEAAASNFEELVGDVFPGGSGRLRLVKEEPIRRAVLGGQSANGAEPSVPAGADADADANADAEAAAESEAELKELEAEELQGVEIEITPAGKSTKRLSLLSGGEKSMTALAFLFAVFLARPCPFYILDEVEAALDDLNLDRFLALLRRYAGRAQFIVITHQKRTMEAADWLYGVSMGNDGVSKILSRRLPPADLATGEEAEAGAGLDAGAGVDAGTSEAPPAVTKAA
jgi:chromosome segregation protein